MTKKETAAWLKAYDQESAKGAHAGACARAGQRAVAILRLKAANR